MNKFLRTWLYNLGITIAVVIGVGIFMLIFMRVFYPEALSAMFMMVQTMGQAITIFKLWPIVVLAIVVSALPRRIRR